MSSVVTTEETKHKCSPIDDAAASGSFDEEPVTTTKENSGEEDEMRALALGKRLDQGNHECEVWLYEGARDQEGAREWRNCKKYPGHDNFIPVSKFSLHHLPDPYRNDDVLSYVHMMAKRTVKLVVKYTSMERPDGYAFANFRGKSVAHTGSGLMYGYDYVEEVETEEEEEGEDQEDEEAEEEKGGDDEKSEQEKLKKKEQEEHDGGEAEAVSDDEKHSDSDEENEDDFKIYEHFNLNLRSCPCPECFDSDSPHRAWGELYVLTAKHVVYDDSEAKKTVIQVNFDDETNNEGVKTLYGSGVSYIGLPNNEDWCSMNCVTHDRQLYLSVYKSQKEFEELKTRLVEKYWDCKDKLAVVVSHPHGWAKRITVGEWKERFVSEVDPNGHELCDYVYDTPTCMGSSGAGVLLLGQRGDLHRTWFDHHHTHSGTSDSADGTGLNASGASVERNVDVDDDDDEEGHEDDKEGPGGDDDGADDGHKGDDSHFENK